jgi:hypothetical protein
MNYLLTIVLSAMMVVFGIPFVEAKSTTTTCSSYTYKTGTTKTSCKTR